MMAIGGNGARRPTPDQYRAAVRRAFDVRPMSESAYEHVRVTEVSPHSDVHPVPDGAFVEVHVWVPDAVAARERP